MNGKRLSGEARCQPGVVIRVIGLGYRQIARTVPLPLCGRRGEGNWRFRLESTQQSGGLPGIGARYRCPGHTAPAPMTASGISAPAKWWRLNRWIPHPQWGSAPTGGIRVRGAALKEVIGKHDAVTDKTALTYGHMLTDKSWGLDAYCAPYGDVRLYLHEGPTKTSSARVQP